MHESRPYGLFVRGAELTDEDLLFIDLCCKKVSNLKQISNLESIKYTRELPNGGYVIVQDAGGVFRAIAYKTEAQEESVLGSSEVKFTMPMLFSGVIDQGVSRNGRGIEVKLTSMCARRVGGYESPVASIQELKRFRCPYSDNNKILIPEYAQNLNPDNLMHTQYTALKATWFSGAMAEVVQIVGGYGRQVLEELPDDPVERAVFTIPPTYMERIKAEIGEAVRLPGYTGLPDKEGKIPFNFSAYTTDVVSFDTEKNPWLVRVQSNGVWAMPLPMIPISITEAFREYIVEVGDTELEMILDRFGGIPSGEGFPLHPADFNRWVRAGVIIKVCDTADFYSHSTYSTACGWSANLDGTNLINTCYDYVNKYCYGYTYQINLKLLPALNRGWVKGRAFKDDPPSNPQKVASYLSELFAELGDEDHKAASIRYKIRRVPMSEIESRTNRSGAADVEYWDNYSCEPIAQHEGRTSCSNSGYLYYGMRFKLPEPAMDGCVHMDFNPQESKSGSPLIDTIVFAYYIGDDLKVIKNFLDERKFIKQTEGNFEDDMIVGSWEQTEYQGLTGLAGYYYSTDFDDRQEIAPVEVYSTLEGKDLGYGKVLAHYHFFFWTDGFLQRTRYYTHQSYQRTTYNKSTKECFVVPYLCRNAALYAQQESASSEKVKQSLKMYGAADPNRYEMWTYDFVWHSFDGGTPKTGRPFPQNSNPVWAEVYNYNHTGTPYSDFADEGDWIGALPADVTHYVNPPSGGITIQTYGGDPPVVEEWEEEQPIVIPKIKYALKVSLNDRPITIHTREHNENYYLASPDSFGNVLYEDACKVMFGNVTYANISEKRERHKYGYSRLANNEHAHTFIGVINE